MEINELLKSVSRNKASDLHIVPNSFPSLRVNGDILPINEEILSADKTQEIVYSLMSEEQKSILLEDLQVDFAVKFDDNTRFRVNACFVDGGISAVLRRVPLDIPTLKSIETPEIFNDFIKLQKGLILVTGATGSGKSTTQAAMLEAINENYKKRIITIEDPIEYIYQNKKSIITQREVGIHTKSFAKALKSSLREDPDIIFVGEMRDAETAEIVLSAAETGHLVISTLHTASAVDATERLINMFPANNRDMIRAMLASSLEAVLCQKLVKHKENNGRVAAFEILVGTPAVKNMIAEGKASQLNSIIQTGSKVGMQTMQSALLELVNKGVISKEEIPYS